MRSEFCTALAVVSLGSSLAASPASAQIYESVGIRAQGMAGAFVAVADDATATWWNPAGLAHGPYFNSIIEFGKLQDPAVPTGAAGEALLRPMRQLGQHRAAVAMFEPEAEESVLTRRTGGKLLRLVPIVGNLRRVAKRAHREFPGYVAVAHQFMNIRTCDLTWIAARMSVSGANADMSSTAAAAEPPLSHRHRALLLICLS